MPIAKTWSRLRWSVYAPFYDVVARRLEHGRRRSIRLLDLKPGERVLIDGAGTGLDFPLLPAGVEITAIDVSPRMIRRAQRRAEELGVTADCRVMDAHRLEFPSESFDVVLLHLILAVIPDPNRCAAEAARVLRPGGRIGIFDKFLPDDRTPSPMRRAGGFITRVLFSDINRQLGPILRQAGLRLAHEEPSLFGGFFKVAVAVKG